MPILPGTEIYIKAKGVYYCNTCGIEAENGLGTVKAGGLEEAFLRDMGMLPDAAADTVLAKSALYMARQLDAGDVAPREVTQYTKEIRLSLLQLHELYPPAEDGDDTEERRAKLQERRRREQGGI
jgi:hypothetical protein